MTRSSFQPCKLARGLPVCGQIFRDNTSAAETPSARIPGYQRQISDASNVAAPTDCPAMATGPGPADRGHHLRVKDQGHKRR
jgi:hypothetical protein